MPALRISGQRSTSHLELSEGSQKASVTGGDAQQGPAKGSEFRAEALKGSRFWARPRQAFERVRTCGEDSPRVRTFGHMLAKTLKGFALLPKPRKGSRFWLHANQNIERVRTLSEGSQRARSFGHVLAGTSKGFGLLVRICKRFGLSRGIC